MFRKKKDVAPREEVFQCSVPGCGLVCLNRESLERHISWKHPELAASEQQKEISPLQTNKT